MRSLTIRMERFSVKQTARSFKVTGTAPETEGQRFSLWERTPGKWRASWNDSTGDRQRIQVQADSLAEAVDLASGKIFGGGFDRKAELTVDGIFDRWLEIQTCNAETKGHYRLLIRYFLKWLDRQEKEVLDWGDLRLEHLVRYAGHLSQKGRSRRTIQKRCHPIRSTARFTARNWPGRFFNFSDGFRLPKPQGEHLYGKDREKNFLTLEALGNLFSWLNEREEGRSILPGVALQGACGMRIRECLRLTWERVDLKAGTVTIEGMVKNVHSVRMLPLPRMVWEILQYLPQEGEQVLSAFDHEDHYCRTVRRLIREWNPSVSIEPKGLRRTLPSVAMRDGWSGFALERFLGHAPKTIMERHYIVQTRAELIDLFRSQIVPRIEAGLEGGLPFGHFGHHSGTLGNVVELRKSS